MVIEKIKEASDEKVFTDGKSEYIDVVYASNRECECFEIGINWHKTVKVRASGKN